MRDAIVVVTGNTGEDAGDIYDRVFLVVEDRSASMREYIPAIEQEIVYLRGILDERVMLSPALDDDYRARPGKAPSRFRKQPDWKISTGRGVRR